MCSDEICKVSRLTKCIPNFIIYRPPPNSRIQTEMSVLFFFHSIVCHEMTLVAPVATNNSSFSQSKRRRSMHKYKTPERLFCFYHCRFPTTLWFFNQLCFNLNTQKKEKYSETLLCGSFFFI